MAEGTPAGGRSCDRANGVGERPSGERETLGKERGGGGES
jgi:hypothetical protein